MSFLYIYTYEPIHAKLGDAAGGRPTQDLNHPASLTLSTTASLVYITTQSCRLVIVQSMFTGTLIFAEL